MKLTDLLGSVFLFRVMLNIKLSSITRGTPCEKCLVKYIGKYFMTHIILGTLCVVSNSKAGCTISNAEAMCTISNAGASFTISSTEARCSISNAQARGSISYAYRY